jgi:hypothetical protein
MQRAPLHNGHNECRMVPEYSITVFGGFDTKEQRKRVSELFPSRSLGKGMPFCFVNASDPRVKNSTEVGDGGGGMCAQVRLVPCGVPRCKADTVPGASSVVCARAAATAVSSGQSPAKLLLANGGFELWARRTNKNGLIRDVAISKNPPASWADVTYRKYPAFPEGANPAEPRFWDLCLYASADLEQNNVGYNASGDEARVHHLLHKLGSLVRCDPVIPRIHGVSLTRHAPGRGGTSVGAGGASEGYTARIEFVKSNDTAALVSENGAVASIVPGVLHVARAWVRCVKGSVTVALVVSSLPDAARPSAIVGHAVQVCYFTTKTFCYQMQHGNRMNSYCYTSVSNDTPRVVAKLNPVYS